MLDSVGSCEYNGLPRTGRAFPGRLALAGALLAAMGGAWLTGICGVSDAAAQAMPGGVGLGTALRSEAGWGGCLALLVNPAGLAGSDPCLRLQVSRLHGIPGLTDSHVAWQGRWKGRKLALGYGSAFQMVGWRSYKELSASPGVGLSVGGTHLGIAGRMEHMQFAPGMPAYRTVSATFGVRQPLGKQIQAGFTLWRMLDLRLEDGGGLARVEPSRFQLAAGAAWHPDPSVRFFAELHGQPGYPAGIAMGGAVRLAEVVALELAMGHAPDWASGGVRLVRERVSVEWMGRWHPELGLTQAVGLVLAGGRR